MKALTCTSCGGTGTTMNKLHKSSFGNGTDTTVNKLNCEMCRGMGVDWQATAFAQEARADAAEQHVSNLKAGIDEAVESTHCLEVRVATLISLYEARIKNLIRGKSK